MREGNYKRELISSLHLARRFTREGDKKKDSYYAHVFAVQLGEPGVVRNGCHDHCQVPGMERHTHILETQSKKIKKMLN